MLPRLIVSVTRRHCLAATRWTRPALVVTQSLPMLRSFSDGGDKDKDASESSLKDSLASLAGDDGSKKSEATASSKEDAKPSLRELFGGPVADEKVEKEAAPPASKSDTTATPPRPPFKKKKNPPRPSTSASTPPKKDARATQPPRPLETTEADDDAFGHSFSGGDDKLGTMPPKYSRDQMTGRLDTETVMQDEALSDKDMDLLFDNNPRLAEKEVAEQVTQHWKSGSLPTMMSGRKEFRKEDTDDEPPEEVPLAQALGERVRKARRDLNVLGRSPAALATAASASAKPETNAYEAATQRLSPTELREFQEYMREHHRVEVNENDIPTVAEGSNADYAESAQAQPTDWAIQWRTEQAYRQMDDSMSENPYNDLTPADLITGTKVNNRRARRIPKELLCVQNVAFLQAFLTPAGLIKSRVHTRLGARDQRKVARLIRRARAIGLMPYSNPFQVEEHGWIQDPTLRKKNWWEEELENRGLKVQHLPWELDEDSITETRVAEGYEDHDFNDDGDESLETSDEEGEDEWDSDDEDYEEDEFGELEEDETDEGEDESGEKGTTDKES